MYVINLVNKNLLMFILEYCSVVCMGVTVLVAFFVDGLVMLVPNSYRHTVVIVVNILMLLGVGAMLIVVTKYLKYSGKSFYKRVEIDQLVY